MELLAFLQKPYNFFLAVVAVVSGAMLLAPFVSRLFSPGRGVSALQAVQLINRRDAVIVDVRDDAEFAAGHIPNARHIPLAQLGERLKELERYKSRPIVVSCRSGTRSASASSILQKHGFSEVFSLSGGVAAWEQASMPVEKSAAK